MGLQVPERSSSLLPQPGWVDLRAWRFLPIETYPSIVAFAQSILGKVTIVLIFAGLLKLLGLDGWIEAGGIWLLLPAAAAAVSVAGRFRHYVLFACAVLLLIHNPKWVSFGAVEVVLRQEYLYGEITVATLRALSLIAFVVVAYLAIQCARAFRRTAPGRAPVLAEHVVYVCLLGVATSGLLHEYAQVAAWCAIAAVSAYFWYLAYALIDQRTKQPAPLVLHLATFNPFSWPTNVPMGKGAANWRGHEANTSEELAITQLKGVKLLAWALLLSALLSAFRWCVYEQLGVPQLKVAFDQFLNGTYTPTPFSLVSVLVSLPEQLLLIAITGHIIIAVARLAGFRLLRNTCRPLSARTVAEFWNRYVYYFKEILVHVYFYPTFVRCFKRYPRLRVAFATFMAAGVGNFFFHFTMQTPTIARYGVLETLVRMQTYAFYCALLSLGIVVSQLRSRRATPEAGWIRYQLIPSLGVLTFFCFLSFFDGPQRHVSLARHFEFLLRSFGVPVAF